MATDRYDANRRYRGTILLANATFAGETPYIALFEERSSDLDPGVRTAGIRGLANHGSAEHAPILIAALEDPDSLVRLEAARALQRVYSDSAVLPLINRLSRDNEPEPDIRAEVARALGQYPRTIVVDSLINALDEYDLTIAYSAMLSLRSLTGQDFGLDRAAWKNWFEDADNAFAMRQPYKYPVFQRDRHLIEWIPVFPPPPNEAPGFPVGYPPELREPAKPEETSTR